MPTYIRVKPPGSALTANSARSVLAAAFNGVLICVNVAPLFVERQTPTWYAADYKNNHSSLPIGTAIVSALLARNATVIFRPHPANRRLPESAAAIGFRSPAAGMLANAEDKRKGVLPGNATRGGVGYCRDLGGNQLTGLSDDGGLARCEAKTLRPTSDLELMQIAMVEMTIEEASAKVRDGGVNDLPADAGGDAWCGVLPVETRIGSPLRQDGLTVAHFFERILVLAFGDFERGFGAVELRARREAALHECPRAP